METARMDRDVEWNYLFYFIFIFSSAPQIIFNRIFILIAFLEVKEFLARRLARCLDRRRAVVHYIYFTVLF